MLANTLGASRFLGSRQSDMHSHLHTAVNRNVVIRVNNTDAKEHIETTYNIYHI